METRAKHLLVEYFECDPSVLDDEHALEQALVAAAEAAKVNIVAKVVHRYAPQGVSALVVIEESHLSVHTWPESGYAAVDFYTCGDGLPERAQVVLTNALRSQSSESVLIERGMSRVAGDSIRVGRKLTARSVGKNPTVP